MCGVDKRHAKRNRWRMGVIILKSMLPYLPRIRKVKGGVGSRGVCRNSKRNQHDYSQKKREYPSIAFQSISTFLFVFEHKKAAVPLKPRRVFICISF